MMPDVISDALQLIPLSEFNVVGSLVQGLGCVYQGRTFTSAREQFWPNALPAATSDLYGYQWELNPGSLSTSLLPYPLSHNCCL